MDLIQHVTSYEAFKVKPGLIINLTSHRFGTDENSVKVGHALSVYSDDEPRDR